MRDDLGEKIYGVLFVWGCLDDVLKMESTRERKGLEARCWVRK